jgi:hypothetical protein
MTIIDIGFSLKKDWIEIDDQIDEIIRSHGLDDHSSGMGFGRRDVQVSTLDINKANEFAEQVEKLLQSEGFDRKDEDNIFYISIYEEEKE